MMADSHKKLKKFKEELADLYRCHKEPDIKICSIQAKKYSAIAPAIVRTIGKHFLKVRGKQKLALIKLVVLLIKDPKGAYFSLLNKRIVEMFSQAYEQADEKMRRSLRFQRLSLDKAVPKKKLEAIDQRIAELSQKLPPTPPTTPPISEDQPSNPPAPTACSSAPDDRWEEYREGLLLKIQIMEVETKIEKLEFVQNHPEEAKTPKLVEALQECKLLREHLFALARDAAKRGIPNGRQLVALCDALEVKPTESQETSSISGPSVPCHVAEPQSETRGLKRSASEGNIATQVKRSRSLDEVITPPPSDLEPEMAEGLVVEQPEMAEGLVVEQHEMAEGSVVEQPEMAEGSVVEQPPPATDSQPESAEGPITEQLTPAADLEPEPTEASVVEQLITEHAHLATDKSVETSITKHLTPALGYCLKIVNQLLQNDKYVWAAPFREPVYVLWPECTSYYDIIQKPMDLSTIKSKLLSYEYKNSGEVAVDIKLIYSNCVEFNGREAVLSSYASTLKGYFTKRFAQCPRDEPESEAETESAEEANESEDEEENDSGDQEESDSQNQPAPVEQAAESENHSETVDQPTEPMDQSETANTQEPTDLSGSSDQSESGLVEPADQPALPDLSDQLRSADEPMESADQLEQIAAPESANPPENVEMEVVDAVDAPTQEEVCLEYERLSQSLVDNIEPQMDSLLELAVFNIGLGPLIVESIEKHLAKVSTEKALLFFNLISSMMENSEVYAELFRKNIVTVFCGVFQLAGPIERYQLLQLRCNWTRFRWPELQELEVRIGEIDSRCLSLLPLPQ